MTRSITISEGEFYHVYNRGTDKRKIFLNRHDYERFIALLYLANSTEPVRINFGRKNLNEIFSLERKTTLVNIGAYCLMPNHFHILVKEKAENGLSRFMQKLTTGYTMYFNKKYDRSGNLFQGVFKAEHANSDEYLKYLYAYIHLNPVKLIEPKWKESGIKNRTLAKNFLNEYVYSSFSRYAYNKESEIIDRKAFPEYFENKSDFDQMIKFWLEYNVQGETLH